MSNTANFPQLNTVNKKRYKSHFLACCTFMKTHGSPPLLSGQSVGGALTSAKSAMSSWFSTLAQPPAVTTPACPDPDTEVKPWNPNPAFLTVPSSSELLATVVKPEAQWTESCFYEEKSSESRSFKSEPLWTGRLTLHKLYGPYPLWGRDCQRYWSKPRKLSDRLFVTAAVWNAGDTEDAHVVGFAVFTLCCIFLEFVYITDYITEK